ncbi:arylsulfatase [Novosphingobium sp. M1R2S20]|uniref:Arylsulfatase n=1 Tax=Novosphingobium rhizovicinum TaxID=3228928 RepID=A0ABV3RGP2_9SPHN
MKKRLGLMLAATMLGIASPAIAQQTRDVLPIPAPPFTGKIAQNVLDSTPTPLRRVTAPAGAPNVFVMMSDDVGFSMASAFGGPVPTPNMERLAAVGQRYNRFHTTGICSPSRAALLTGRNHHNAGVGFLSDMPTGFPGYGGTILPQTATIAQVLRLNGYNTAMFGKHHNVPGNERSEAGPFDNWPTGLGFEYFYGFPHGDTDQFEPNLYRGIAMVAPEEGNGELLDHRLASDVIRWVHNQKAGAPDKPFFVYLSPGSTHAPHQAPAEWIARFKGKFDQGWDKVREQIWRRQLAMGIIPRGTKLTARPAEIPAWDSLTPGQKRFAARTMEVAAAQLAYQDEQLGRVIEELRRMGQLDNTLVAVINGDNGASGEAGPKGTINELRSMAVHDEDEAWMQANIDRLGGPMTYQSYPVGWALAMNTPLRWVKQYGSMLGGVRNGMILSWSGHVARPGSICGEFSHVIDIVPTVLEAAKLPAPRLVNGIEQKPVDGISLLDGLSGACDANKPRTQYFEMTGKAGLYHNGWFLSGDDGRPSWENLPSNTHPQIKWTLYDLREDWSQSTDVAAQHPAQLQAMLGLWEREAERYNVYPLDHRMGAGRIDRKAIAALMGGGRKRFDFWGKDVSIPAMGQPILFGRSFTLDADLVLDKADSSGAIVALASRFGGWSLYLDQGRPAFTWARSTDPNEIRTVKADKALPRGKTQLTMRFAVAQPGGPAEVVLSSSGREFGRVSLPASVLTPAGGGEMLDIGRDLGVPVTEYVTPRGRIEGDIPHVSVTFD